MDSPSPRFEEALAWLSSFTDYEQIQLNAPLRTTFDLGRLERLLARFDAPHRGRPVVHVTGTKGKSSVTLMVDAILRNHGLRTLRFLSPHVERLHERLAVDGTEVTDDAFADLVGELRPEVERLKDDAPEDLPSFFEAMTVLGFLWAARAEVDALALEVGLGGRLDATNVVDPTVAVVTSVGLDHVRILGDTIEQIATEKGGILKPGRPAVLGMGPGGDGFTTLHDIAEARGCPVAYPGEGLSLHEVQTTTSPAAGPRLAFSGTAAEVPFPDLELAAGSPHQAMNALVAIRACLHVVPDLDPARVRAALRALRFPGRAEWFPKIPALVDGAHTKESVAALVSVVKDLADGRPVHLLCGLTRDRDPARVFAPLLPHVASFVATDLPTPRTLAARDVHGALREQATSPGPEPDPEAALARVSDLAGGNGLVLVAGSLYLAGAVRPLLRSR